MRRWLGKVWRRYRADETVLVSRPRRSSLGLVAHAACMIITGTVASFVAQSNSWYAIFGAGYLGGLIGVTALGRYRQARAYWSGWLGGRSAMVSSLAEAGRREMDMHDWLSAEISRDLALIGAKGNKNDDKGDPRD